ncbi:MAG: response regulator [Pseudomonadota bacterium]
MRLLVVDDEIRTLGAFTYRLEEMAEVVDLVESAADAFAKIELVGRYGYVISDHRLGPDSFSDEQHNGIFVLSAISEKAPGTKTILFTLSPDIERHALQGGIDACFNKMQHRELVDWIKSDWELRRGA